MRRLGTSAVDTLFDLAEIGPAKVKVYEEMKPSERFASPAIYGPAAWTGIAQSSDVGHHQTRNFLDT